MSGPSSPRMQSLSGLSQTQLSVLRERRGEKVTITLDVDQWVVVLAGLEETAYMCSVREEEMIDGVQKSIVSGLGV